MKSKSTKSIETEKLKACTEKPINNLFKTINWNGKETHNPIRVKKHTTYNSKTDWKEVNTELVNVKNYSKSKYDPSKFRLDNMSSNIIGTDQYKKSKDPKEMIENSGNGFAKLRSVSQENNQTFTNLEEQAAKQRKFNNLRSNFSLKEEEKSGSIQNKGAISEVDLSTKSNSEINEGNVSNVNKYEISIGNSNISSSEIKKLFDKRGIHVYNMKEQSNWSNGNNDCKLMFDVRDTKLSLSQEQILLQKELNSQSIQIKVQEVQPTEKTESNLIPVQLKWNDTKLNLYKGKGDVGEPKNTKSDYKLKRGPFEFDSSLLTYKNDKKYSEKTKSEKSLVRSSESRQSNPALKKKDIK